MYALLVPRKNYKYCTAFYIFQCDCSNYGVGHESLHIFTHHTNKSVADMINDIWMYMECNRRAVGGQLRTILSSTKNGIRKYIKNLVSSTFILDEGKLYLIARIYRLHVAVIHRNGFWCTREDEAIDKCDCVLVYHDHGIYNITEKRAPFRPVRIGNTELQRRGRAALQRAKNDQLRRLRKRAHTLK